MFVLGNTVQSGILGGVPNLADLDQGDVRFAIDFRDVYAALLRGSLGIDPTPALGERRRPETLPRNRRPLKEWEGSSWLQYPCRRCGRMPHFGKTDLSCPTSPSADGVIQSDVSLGADCSLAAVVLERERDGNAASWRSDCLRGFEPTSARKPFNLVRECFSSLPSREIR